MKKVLFLSIIILIVQFPAFTQKPKIGFTGGLGGGVAITNYKYDGDNSNIHSNTCLTMGILWEVPIQNNFVFQPSLNYVGKGNHEKLTSGNETSKLNLYVSNLETQMNFLYHTPGENGNFFIGAGPSIALAIDGKWKFTKGDTKEENSVTFGNDASDDMNMIDFGGTVICGYNFPKLVFISASYNAGFKNLNAGDDKLGKIKSNYFAIKLGFLFRNQKDQK